MKILMLYTREFWLKPYSKTLPEAPNFDGEMTAKEAVIALIHVEEKDSDNRSKIITKSVKNIKWLAGKFNSKNVVLHSFAHLSSSKSPPHIAESFLTEIAERLVSRGFTVQITPFGYFNEFKLHVAGPSLAKVFVEL